MQSAPYPPPQLPPAGWYADPAGEPFLRYWDGLEWTSDTDTIPPALKRHSCPAVVDGKLALAVGKLRGWRLIVAAMRDDGDDNILNEIEGCALCLTLMVAFCANAAGSVAISLANEHKALAITLAEKQLAEYVDEARRQL
jgi:Protein of unknown function (DUF2510)